MPFPQEFSRGDRFSQEFGRGDVYGEGGELLAAALRYRSISLKNLVGVVNADVYSWLVQLRIGFQSTALLSLFTNLINCCA
jgi:hypothetical protein